LFSIGHPLASQSVVATVLSFTSNTSTIPASISSDTSELAAIEEVDIDGTIPLPPMPLPVVVAVAVAAVVGDDEHDKGVDGIHETML